MEKKWTLLLTVVTEYMYTLYRREGPIQIFGLAHMHMQVQCGECSEIALLFGAAFCGILTLACGPRSSELRMTRRFRDAW